MAAPMYPVVLRIEGRRCLVVGGGPVAARKVHGLLECGALVTVVAPDVDASIDALSSTHPGTLAIERRPYRSGEAAEYRLVVTATGTDVDRLVAADAESARIWVNSADDAAHCTFILPSVHRDGPVSVSVSTGGASPALASWLRRSVAASLGERLGELAGLIEEGRRSLIAAGRPTTAVDWPALLDGDLPALVRSGDIDGAQRLVAEVLEEALTEPPSARA
jgi:siroheme synthase-like protein